MSNTHNIIIYGGNNIRSILRGGEPWFVAKDVCDILGIKQSTRAIEGLSKDDVSTTHFISKYGDTAQREQEMLIVNESGLYQLIFQSRKPEAKEFTRWVTSEVLPMIRKYGFYSTDPKKVELADKKLEAKAVKELLKEIDANLSYSDKKRVAKQCEVHTMDVFNVLNGRTRDVSMLTVLYGRATGNRHFAQMFYTKEGSEQLLAFLQEAGVKAGKEVK